MRLILGLYRKGARLAERRRCCRVQATASQRGGYIPRGKGIVAGPGDQSFDGLRLNDM